MNGMSSAATAARLVRTASAAMVLVVVLAAVAISSFSVRYGNGGRYVAEPASNDHLLSAAVAEQESAGLVCSARPGLADVVLFQAAGSSSVTALRFDVAVQAVSAREGAIRRYCG